MRLPEDRIKQAILHPDGDARQAAVTYFEDVYSRDPEVMPLAIRALEQYGRGTAFRYFHVLTRPAQTETTIDWVVRELQQARGERTYLDNLSDLLCHADPPLVLPRAREILDAPGFAPILAPRFRERLELLSWDAARCWAELGRIAEEGKAKYVSTEIDYGHALQVVEALSRQGEAYRERVLSLLAQPLEDSDDNPLTWLECFVVALAGEMRLQAAIPLIVRKLHGEGEVLLSECLHALARIGTDETTRALADGFPEAAEDYRLFAAEALGNIHTDLAVQRVLELLPGEQDYTVRANLGHALVSNFVPEGVEVVRRMILEDSYDSFLIDLRDGLVAACKVMDVTFPEMAAWEKEAEEKDRAVEARRRALESPPVKRPPPPPRELPLPVKHPFVQEAKKVGRNDPCPCGSGKKFKVCCLRKG
jgi:hypothetical protein